MKAAAKSKILWLNVPTAGYFLLDAADQFVHGGGLDSICAKKSAFAAATMTLTAVARRWFTNVPLGKEK
jgi:hypothetical protein